MDRRSPLAPIAFTALLVLVLAFAGATPAAEQERRLETVTAELVPPDGRFQPLPRWTATGRPTLALALSGGGARGLSHVGVLQAMHEDGVELDAVAGTSIGAMAGALLCGGHSPHEIEDILRRRDWDQIISGLDVRTRVLSQVEDIRQSSSLFRIRLRRRQVLQVGALLDTRVLERELYRYLIRAQLESGGDFDRLACPFRAVTADILTGTALVPDQGDLVALVRGSFAVPGVFRPVPYGDALLVDGGIVENIPTETARGFGKDLVFAVDVSEGLPVLESVRSSVAVLDRSFSVASAARNRELLKMADLVLTPEVREYSRAAFRTQLDALLEAGRRVYAEHRDTLWQVLEAASHDRSAMPFDAVEVTGTSWLTAAQLEDRLGGAPGSPTRFRVRAELARVLNLGPLSAGRVEHLERGGRRVLRFVFEENPPVRALAREGDPVPWPDEVGVEVPPGRPFSLALARRVGAQYRQALVDRGRVLVRIDTVEWDAEEGVIRAHVSDLEVGRIQVEVDGELERRRTQAHFDDLQGRKFRFDRLADRLDEAMARGAISQWSLMPHYAEDDRVNLQLRVHGDDYFEAMSGLTYRGTLGWGGYARTAKANLTGRGDYVDFSVVASHDQVHVGSRYHTEYGFLSPRTGLDSGILYFRNDFPIIGDDQRYRRRDEEAYRGERAWAALVGRAWWGSSVHVGLFHERMRLEATEVEPPDRRNRTSAYALLDFDRHDRLLFPTRGSALKLNLEKSLAGYELWKAEARADTVRPVGPDRRHTLTARAALGLSDGADRRPHWFNPGGYRDLYGFAPYGAAGAQYARAGLVWRSSLQEIGAARLYLEGGFDAIRTADLHADLRRAETRYGYGVSATAFVRFLGPVTLGVMRNDARSNTVFITAGYPFLD
jgi:predicted acylesterase/phospholipase RssA